MKINVNMELTPKELRELFGLPEVDDFNRLMMDKLAERMQQGGEGYDPLTFFKSHMAGPMAGSAMDVFQKWMATAAGGGVSTDKAGKS